MNELSALLLRLSAEIRLMIFSFVFEPEQAVVLEDAFEMTSRRKSQPWKEAHPLMKLLEPQLASEACEILWKQSRCVITEDWKQYPARFFKPDFADRITKLAITVELTFYPDVPSFALVNLLRQLPKTIPKLKSLHMTNVLGWVMPVDHRSAWDAWYSFLAEHNAVEIQQCQSLVGQDCVVTAVVTACGRIEAQNPIRQPIKLCIEEDLSDRFKIHVEQPYGSLTKTVPNTFGAFAWRNKMWAHAIQRADNPFWRTILA